MTETRPRPVLELELDNFETVFSSGQKCTIVLPRKKSGTEWVFKILVRVVQKQHLLVLSEAETVE